MPENELISSLKKGSHEAFNNLYNLYWKHIYNFCRLYVSKENAEEILQEVFIKIWIKRSLLDENKNFKGYLFIITRNELFEWFRKKEISDYQILPLISILEESSDNMEEEVSTGDLRSYIDGLILKLPSKSRIIFNLSRNLHLTNQEIAEKLHISVKAVEAGITRALKILRENIDLMSIFLII